MKFLNVGLELKLFFFKVFSEKNDTEFESFSWIYASITKVL